MTGIASQPGTTDGHMPEVAAEAARSRMGWSVLRDYGIVASFIALFAIFAVTQDAFLTTANLKNILAQNAPVGIAACATTVAIIAGGFDLSIGAVYALAGVVSAWLALRIDPVLALVAGVLVGALLGAGNGVLVAALKLNSFLATLATSLIVRGAAVLISGGFLIQVTSSSYTSIGSSSILGFQTPTFIFAAFALVLGLVLSKTMFGRHVYAIGGNEQAARLSGVPVGRVRVIAFAISGFGAALAGVLAATRIGQGQADVGVGLELTAIASVVVGGTSILGGSGAMWRTVLGVLFLALIANGFNLAGIDPIYRDILTGAIIIVAITLNSFSQKT